MSRRRRYRPNVPFLCAVAIFVVAVAAYIGLGVLSAALAPRRLGVPSGLTLPLVARSLDALSAVWFFAVGASIGSFLNVVAYRLPRGRTLGGHSACPYCCTPIAAADNIPVFAWFQLRGRCRTCRLPISIEYPLIELMVGLAFLSVYFTEFAVAGRNLPGTPARTAAMGLVWMTVTPLLATRVFLFLLTVSGLIAAALIVARRVSAPISLFVWVLLIVVAGQLIKPEAVVVTWSHDAVVRAPTHIDVLLTVALGWLAGLLSAALTLPLLNRATSQLAWYGTLSCVGVMVGWQGTVLATVCILIVTWFGQLVLRGPLRRWSWTGTSVDPVIWAWIGLLIFRANWKVLDPTFGYQTAPMSYLIVAAYVSVGIILAWLLGRAAHREVMHGCEPSLDVARQESAATQAFHAPAKHEASPADVDATL